MKLVQTKDAVGHVLCHDITQIIPGVKKSPVFKKGHVMREEDIPVLLDYFLEVSAIRDSNRNAGRIFIPVPAHLNNSATSSNMIKDIHR